MKKSITLVVALAAAMFAQGPGTQTPSIAEITTYLTLSATQVAQLQTIQKNEQTAIQTTAADIATKQQALQTALQKGGSSAAVLGQMLLDIEALRKKITDAQSAAQTSSLLVLNATQKDKLKTLDAASQLAPSIHEATMLNLLTPPASANGPGAGPRGFGGPGGPGTGPQFRRGPRMPIQE